MFKWSSKKDMKETHDARNQKRKHGKIFFRCVTKKLSVVSFSWRKNIKNVKDHLDSNRKKNEKEKETMELFRFLRKVQSYSRDRYQQRIFFAKFYRRKVK